MTPILGSPVPVNGILATGHSSIYLFYRNNTKIGMIIFEKFFITNLPHQRPIFLSISRRFQITIQEDFWSISSQHCS
ncbi:TPA: hypothetical protein L6A81_21345 [Pseudomonas aeruginosa]|uniref:Uncharacterized protein n=1 Tax=Pseudomonas aeruginosa TaxID=287 RepID=A0A241XWP8_PSEAI|nr:hypothetical protein HW05_05725 [Pseudomonas aeruginosa]KEA29645.1 hypothetical protein BH79_14030 [Pseudomonas aeruginosa C0324C]KFF33046.1 hypothetical protein G039_0326595 [Pseudomonas aeruginosa VRFPA01]OFM70905.1 hypothetical protein HMPREF2670_22435 [Pseudomonas sp. HMSC072F09]OFR47917.1 hypothetical protein HMPREF2886_18525 [Pseudomonas sp. HMSC066A08]OFS90343.1 hypothetical protein HMPREF3141_17045 [Pseudomonas sp. HMSC16B01]OHS11916.1 hypothetical protein HMPREF3289_08495 [Pseudom